MTRISVGKPVKGDLLIGREKDIRVLTELIMQGQSVVIIAPRRMGKTSLVIETLNRLKKKGLYTAYIDIFTTPDIESLSKKIVEETLNNNKLGKIFKKISGNITEVFRNIELKQTIENFEFLLKYSTPKPDMWELLTESIDFINAYPKKQNKKMVCAFDEFGDIEKLDGNKIVKLIRSKIQVQDNAAYIFTGSYESVMETMFVKPDSPFFRFARIIQLGYIDKEEFRKYITKVLTEDKITLADSLIDEILDFTKGHPYYTQLILQQILIFKSVDSSMDITMEMILDQLLAIENNYLEKQWEEISRSKELVQTIIAILRYKTSLYSYVDTKKINLARALKKLTGLGILLHTGKVYHLSDPLFELWIRKKVLDE